MSSESTLVLSITISRMTAKKQKLFDFFSNPVAIENINDVYVEENMETDVFGEEFAVTVFTYYTFVFHQAMHQRVPQFWPIQPPRRPADIGHARVV